MNVDERMITYINSLYKGNTPILCEIEKEALDTHVPVIRQEMQSLLRFFLDMKRPGRILEVGCATGFSAILMAEYGSEDVQITTIEKYEKRIPKAVENFKRAGREQQITLLKGDAKEILADLSKPYDFIFMDAAKGQYIHFLPHLTRLLCQGGLLISDNVLQDGDLVESHYAVERRNRTIYKRMRDYLYQLTHHDELTTMVLPVGDGVTVSVKKQEKRILPDKSNKE